MHKSVRVFITNFMRVKLSSATLVSFITNFMRVKLSSATLVSVYNKSLPILGTRLPVPKSFLPPVVCKLQRLELESP